MDEIERAEAFQAKLNEAAIENIRKNTEIPVNTTGLCLTCGEPVDGGRRWCDAECRDAGACK